MPRSVGSSWHSRGAGLAAGHVFPGGHAAQPGAAQVGGGVEGAQPPTVTAADLAQNLDPLAGLHTVTRLDVERLLPVDHLEHLSRPRTQSTS